MRSSLSGFLKCDSRAVSILLSDAERVISSIGFLIKVKAQLQILTLKTCDQRTDATTDLLLWILFLVVPKLRIQLWGGHQFLCDTKLSKYFLFMCHVIYLSSLHCIWP